MRGEALLSTSSDEETDASSPSSVNDKVKISTSRSLSIRDSQSKSYDSTVVSSVNDDSSYSSRTSVLSLWSSSDGGDEGDEFSTDAGSKNESVSVSVWKTCWAQWFGPRETNEAKDMIETSSACGDRSEAAESEKREETFADKLREKLPDCQNDDIFGLDDRLEGKKNELHQLVTKSKWNVLRRRLQLLTDFNEEASKASKEGQQKDKLETMIREVDEHGRTPLSLACGKSSAPLDVITAMVNAFPLSASTKDKNDNLPIHHFCHSYEIKAGEVTEGEWRVLELLHSTNPTGARSVNAYGNTPLHIYLEHRCGDNMRVGTLDVVLELLKIYPEATSIANKGGSLPMHHIGKVSSPKPYEDKRPKLSCGAEDISTIIFALHRANRDAMRTKNNFGATPFFIATVYNADVEVWKAMLRKYPEAAVTDNGRGVTPIAAYWNMFVSLKAKKKYLNLNEEQSQQEGKVIEKHRKDMSKVKSLQHLRLKAPAELIDFWNKMELMLRAGSSGTVSQRLANDGKWRVLHAICSITDCPSDALKFALQMYSFQAEEADEEGNLPIHAAASLGGKDLSKRQSDNVHAMIRRLLSAYEYGAEEFNSKGQLSLHLALISGKSWTTGVETLLNANKSATRVQDPVTGLYPFMLAAARSPASDNGSLAQSTNELDTVFELLLAAPYMVLHSEENQRTGTNLQKKNYELLMAKASLAQHCRDVEQDTSKLKEDLKKKEVVVAKLQRELLELKLKMTAAEEASTTKDKLASKDGVEGSKKASHKGRKKRPFLGHWRGQHAESKAVTPSDE